MRLRLQLKIIIYTVILSLYLVGMSRAIEVPFFAQNAPEGHFIGVSDPAESIAKARRIATMDVVRQILDSIGVTYNHKSKHKVFGSPKNPKREFDDFLSGTSKGLVLGVSERIVKSSVVHDENGQYVSFILVDYPESLIDEMRRLSLGAGVSASVIQVSKGSVKIRVSEINGVMVNITSAHVHIITSNRFAKKISYFIMHVPNGSSEDYRASIPPVVVCKSSEDIMLPLKSKGIGYFLLGAKVSHTVVFSGTDEVGRDVQARVEF
jgi:hypothetical protein